METVLQTFTFILTIGIAYALGTIIEQDHYVNIQKREKDFLSLPAVSSKSIEQDNLLDGQLVYGSVVISHDYFKRFLASLRNLTGGRITAYESLLDRARREAILRMKEQARLLGADMVVNMRFATSSVGDEAWTLGCFELLAYGTAVRLKIKPT